MKLDDLLSCPDCHHVLDAGLRCSACAFTYSRAADIARLLPRSLRLKLGDDGESTQAAVRTHDHSAENISLANIQYHAQQPELYGKEPLASIGMFDTEGNAQRRLAEAIARLARQGRADVLLDVGCGDGNVLRHARAHFKRPIGVDVCVPMLKLAAQAGHTVLVGDAYQLPFRDGSVDVVTAFSFLHHLAEPSCFLSEVARVLRPGGQFYSDWDPNGSTRHRSKLFQVARDALIDALASLRLTPKPRYYESDTRSVAELAEFGWHFGEPLNGRALANELRRLGLADAKVIFHDDCPSLDTPQLATLSKRAQRFATLLLNGDWRLVLQGRDAAAEFFLLLAQKPVGPATHV